MTDEEREAAIEAMRSADDPGKSGASRLLPLANPDAERYLDALLSEFVVLSRDDVTREYGWYDRVRQKAKNVGRHLDPQEADDPDMRRRLVSRWEPITKEQA